ncbi:MAG: VWA domain-containing protein, partial [bacterium]
MKISQLILLSFFSVCYLFFGQTALAQQQNVREPEEYTLDLVVTQAPGDDGSIDVTWYSPENFNRFVVDFKDLVSGETRKLAVSGDNSLRIGDIDPLNQYSVSVTAVGDRDRSVGYSPKEIWSGKKVERLTGVRTVRQPVPLLFVPNLEATLRSLDSNNFPFIFTTIAVDTGGQPVGGLTKADFTAFEDGRVQTDFFEVTPPEEGGNVRILDFVFIIDNSLSMQAEQQEVKDNVKAFVDSLGARQIDVRLGLVRFGQTASGGQPIIMNNGNMTSDINFFKTLLDQMTVDGGFEPGLKAVFEAATTFSFRPGSQRHFLLITDEDSDGGNLAQTINTCQNNNIIVHTAVRCNFGNSNNDYCNSSSIRGATDGLLFNVEGPYRDILDSLIDPIGNTYIVRYRTDNPVFDGQQREVRIVINAFGQSDEVIGFYTPGAAPKIQRTQATINLSNSAQIAGIPLTIAAQITDAVAPFVQSATLFYRTTGVINYVSIPMNLVGNNIYEASIAGPDVQDPGVDYYITATDGQVTSSDPTVDPDIFPYQIAVLPNQPPQITHTPVTSGSPGQDILISATVVDNTTSLTSVDLHYREISTLLFQHVSMAAVGGDQYEGFIPNSVVTNAGVEYFIRAVDDFGLASIHGIHTIIISDTSECAPLFFDDFEDSNADGW